MYGGSQLELGKVVGNVWATKKETSLNGHKLLVIQGMISETERKQELTIATDIIGAGVGDVVLVVRGGSARYAIGSPNTPIDAAIVGIVDSVEIL